MLILNHLSQEEYDFGAFTVCERADALSKVSAGAWAIQCTIILTANSSKPACLVVGAIGAITSFLGILEKFHAKSNRANVNNDVQGFGR